MRFFSFLFRILAALGLLLLSLPLLALLMALDPEPLATGEPGLSATEIDTVQQLLIDNDPRLLLGGKQDSVTLLEEEATILLKYLISETPQLHGVRAQVSMEDESAEVRLTRPLDNNLLNDYLNIRIGFNESSNPVHIAYINIGDIELPDYVIGPVLNWVQKHYGEEPNYQLLVSTINTVDSVELNREQAVVYVDLDDEGLNDISSHARDILIAAPAQDLIVHYYETILDTEANLIAERSNLHRRGLNTMLRPLFAEAYQRSLDGADPIQENQALLIALAVYLSDLELEQVTQVEQSFPERQLTFIINRRRDLAQHIALSAAISVSSSANIVDLISVYKEVYDSRYRTGFSFDDMMANQVGSTLGEIARRDHDTALQLQRILKDVSDETVYMPADTTNETMTEAEFLERYGSRQSAAYHQELEKMETAISERPLFQTFNTVIDIE